MTALCAHNKHICQILITPSPYTRIYIHDGQLDGKERECRAGTLLLALPERGYFFFRVWYLCVRVYELCSQSCTCEGICVPLSFGNPDQTGLRESALNSDRKFLTKLRWVHVFLFFLPFFPLFFFLSPSFFLSSFLISLSGGVIDQSRRSTPGIVEYNR